MKLLIIHSSILFADILYLHLLLTRKKSIKYALVMFIINYLIIVVGYILCYTFLKDTIFDKYTALILGCTLMFYIYLVFEESILKKIFTMFTLWVFSYIILIISSYIMNFFYIKDFDSYKNFVIFLRVFIQLSFIPIICLYFRQPYKEMIKLVSNSLINIISFYSMVIFLFLVNYYEIYYYKRINFYGLFNNLLSIGIIILSYIIIFIAIWSANRNIELEYKIKFIDTQIELQKQNYKTLNESIENYNAFKHDIRHHLLAIKSIIDAKNYKVASEYVDKFTESEACQNVGVLCKNFTVDSILKYYMRIAMNNNIDFNVNLNIPEDINIDNFDLSVVLGNCTQNAIEACKNIINDRKKYINIKAEIKGFQLVVKIKNSFNGHVIKECDTIKTIKNGEGHGIGLSNVRNITEKYNGYFNIKYNDNEFEVNIIMNYN